MKIRFTYDGKRRSGELVAFYTANNGSQIAKVREDGTEFPKSFSVNKMLNTESGSRRTDEELLPILKAAADSIMERFQKNGVSFDGNPLELLLSAVFRHVGGGRAELQIYVDDVEDAIGEWS